MAQNINHAFYEIYCWYLIWSFERIINNNHLLGTRQSSWNAKRRTQKVQLLRTFVGSICQRQYVWSASNKSSIYYRLMFLVMKPCVHLILKQGVTQSVFIAEGEVDPWSGSRSREMFVPPFRQIQLIVKWSGFNRWREMINLSVKNETNFISLSNTPGSGGIFEVERVYDRILKWIKGFTIVK